MKSELGKSRMAGRVDADEILPEYDFSRAGPNKFAPRYAAGSVVAVLEPDVALAGLIRKHQPRRTASRRSA